MNIDRGKDSFTTAEVDQLREQLKLYKEDVDIGWGPLADRVGDVGGSTLSAFCGGTYNGGDPEKMKTVAWKVNRFFLAEEARQETALLAPIVPGFKLTPTARRMMAQLQFARQGKFVVITGHPGVGKTAVFDQFCAQTPNAFKVTMNPATKSLTSMLLAVLKASGSTSSYGGRGMHLMQAIIDRLRDFTPA